MKKKNKNKTTLAHYIWNLKNQNKTFRIKWKIIKKCRLFKSGQKQCDVCDSDKNIHTTRKKKKRKHTKLTALVHELVQTSLQTSTQKFKNTINVDTKQAKKTPLYNDRR